MDSEYQPNIAETIYREAMKPEVSSAHDMPFTASPQHWTLQPREDLLPQPLRKRGTTTLDEVGSFVAVVNRHKSRATQIYCQADFVKGDVSLVAVLNDHDTDVANWGDHQATLSPPKSVEWNRWTGANRKEMQQAEFAMFIEDNIGDIAAVEGMPTGSQMLAMALNFEANRDMRFKSAVRLQSGGVQMHFVDDDEKETAKQMQVFERFSLGLPVFLRGSAYQLDARLKYRVRDGRLTFWYELIRPDKVIQHATETLLKAVSDGTEIAVLFGKPAAVKAIKE